MRRIKEALEQARHDGILRKSSVAGNAGSAERFQTNAEAHQTVTPKSVSFRSVDLNPDILRKNLIFQGRETDSFSMAYKMLRTQVYQKMQTQNWSTLGITSAGPGEGKSLTAINLAFSLARASSRPVILVDLDLRRPTLVSKLGISTDMGVSDYFLNGAELQEVLLRISDNLLLAPGTTELGDSSEILSSIGMVKFMRELTDTQPGALVLFDLPPILVVDDVLALSPSLDACLMVAEEGKTKQEDLQQALDLLKMTNLLGVVLNKSGEVAKNHYYDKY